VTLLGPAPTVPVTGGRGRSVHAGLTQVDGRPVAAFRVEGGRHAGALGPADSATIERTLRQARDLDVPIVGLLSTSGADVTEGVASLHAWGRIARLLARASGEVPIILGVTGPCLSGPALVLGLADHVVMTPDAFAYVSGPDAVREMTGVEVTSMSLGGPDVQSERAGVATMVVDEDQLDAAIAELLSYLPSHTLDDAPHEQPDDPVDRDCVVAASVVPTEPTASYDVRDVVRDVLDDGSFLELRPRYAPNLVTAYGRVDGHAVGIIANQPRTRAGTLDIEASRKAARHVQHCDVFNLPIVTFVDTPGFEPGKDLEWRGMIRHGAELVHAYCEATVPRVCVVLRKSYGGAYIVMDSKGVGNDICLAWPASEIAVMGAKGAVQILFARELRGLADDDARDARRAELEAQYVAEYCTPRTAAERGYADDVIDPADTRRAVAASLAMLATKRERPAPRRHTNGPL
jgi:acetyl-CoA carboxylase carboxyltransferase component